MNADRQKLFEEITPPPGGAEQFAQRLETELAAMQHASSQHRRALAAAGCAALLVLLVLAGVLWTRDSGDTQHVLVADLQPPVEVYGAPEFDRLLGRPSQPAELAVRLGAETATVTQVETTNEKIRIYRIE